MCISRNNRPINPLTHYSSNLYILAHQHRRRPIFQQHAQTDLGHPSQRQDAIHPSTGQGFSRVKRAGGVALINPSLHPQLPPSRPPGDAAAAAAASTATAGDRDGKISSPSATFLLLESIAASVLVQLAFSWVGSFTSGGTGAARAQVAAALGQRGDG